MNSWPGFLLGAGLGATCMYLADPAGGARRRGVIRDKLTHAGRLAADGLDATGHDFAHRAQGLWISTRQRFEAGEIPDFILVERVRAKLGRYVSHPHAIEVNAEAGLVTLRGEIPNREVLPLIRAIGKIHGVHGIDNLLEQHETAESIPSLEGDRRQTGGWPDIAQQNWSPATRTLVGSIGSAVLAYGATRRDIVGALLGMAGAGLVVRAATNLDTSRLSGVVAGHHAVDIQKAIHIDAPVSTVFDFWTDLENFPRFMRNVREVRDTKVDGRSHWTVAGPAGYPVEFDAVITELVPNQALAWKTVEGGPVQHAGVIRFEPDGQGTRLQIRFSYNPPAGAVGHALASLLGEDPKSKMDEDLGRMKTLIETGNPPRDAARAMQPAPEPLM